MHNNCAGKALRLHNFRRGKLVAALFAALINAPALSHAQTPNSSSAELTDIIVNAYSHHPQLKSLRSQLRGTREAIVEARASYLPQVVLDGNFSTSDRSALLQNGTRFDQNTTPKSLSLRMNQTLYAGGRRSLAKRAASLTVQSSEARYETIATGIAAEIIQDYMSLLSAEEERRVLNESVKTLKHLEASTIARRKVGDSTRTEIAQAKSRVASAQARLASATSNLNLARSRILSTTGFLVENPKLPKDATIVLTESLEDIKSMARQASPAMKTSRLSEISAGIRAQSETRKHLPTVSLTASATTVRDSSPTINKDDQLSVGIRFTMPIYTAGVGNSQTRRALAAYNSARFEHQDTVRQTDLRITQLWSQIQNGIAVLEAQKASVVASEDALKGVIRGEDVGLSDTQDILDAQQNKLEAELTYARAQYQQHTTRLLLKLYTGQLDVYNFD